MRLADVTNVIQSTGKIVLYDDDFENILGTDRNIRIRSDRNEQEISAVL